MKKYFSITLFLALAVITISSCKKDQAKPDDQEMYSAELQIVAEGADPMGARLIGTKDQILKAISNPKGTPVQRIAAGDHIFTPVDPVDSYGLCWAEIEAYYQAHIAEWQATANRNCRELLICITCPKAGVGLFVMYSVKPNCAEAVSIKDSLKPYKS